MQNLLEKLINMSEKRINYFENGGGTKGFYKGSETFFEQICLEVAEAKDENRQNNSVYLEDELGDVLWDYLCLLNSLKEEGKITSIEKVLKRSYKKYSERIKEKTGENNGVWKEVKQKQKEELKKENDLLNKN